MLKSQFTRIYNLMPQYDALNFYTQTSVYPLDLVANRLNLVIL
jgi:hypothetical protein